LYEFDVVIILGNQIPLVIIVDVVYKLVIAEGHDLRKEVVP
jgi:hypothetical protein